MNPTTTRTAPGSARPALAPPGACRTAGIGLLLMAALSAYGVLVVEGLHTAADVVASEGLLRLGIASLLLVVTLDVVVAWALYRVFRPAHDGLSMLAAWFRIAYAGVFLVAIGQLAGALRPRAPALSGIDTFHDIWAAGLVLFGVHLLMLGYLAYRSGYVPRLLGVLLAIAGFGYAFDSFAAVLAPEAVPELGVVTWIGEFLLALWLVIRGRRIHLPA